MTSFLVVSKDKAKRQTYIQKLCADHAIDHFDQTLIEKEESSKNTQSIGIEEIKNMQKKLFLKPIKSQTKAVILEDAQLLTPEAQNALLKVLEEPPEHTIIVLSAESHKAMLPTILSRCQIISVETQDFASLSEKTRQEYIQIIKDIPNMTVGERLKKAELLAKDKDKAIKWLEKMIIVSREKLLETYNVIPDLIGDPGNIDSRLRGNDNIKILKLFQRLHTLLKTTNVNPRLAIENTLLALT